MCPSVRRRHSIVDKWQTLEAARHRIAQWKSNHHDCEGSWVRSPVLSLSKFMFETCQLPPSYHPRDKGQATSGGLAHCSKNTIDYVICNFPKWWREVRFILGIFSGGLSYVPLFFEHPFLGNTYFPAAPVFRALLLGTHAYFLAHPKFISCSCTRFRFSQLCHEILLSYSSEENDRNSARCQVV